MSDVVGEVTLNTIELGGTVYGAGACVVTVFGNSADGIAVKAGDERHVTDDKDHANQWLIDRGCPRATAQELVNSTRSNWTAEQYKAAKDALVIQKGACNGTGVAHALVKAYLAWLHIGGTDEANTSAPVQLILHQLAHLAGARFDLYENEMGWYDIATKECQEIVAEYEAANPA